MVASTKALCAERERERVGKVTEFCTEDMATLLVTH